MMTPCTEWSALVVLLDVPLLFAIALLSYFEKAIETLA
jgi:hypothetical protein